jgi:hypothetical protein
VFRFYFTSYGKKPSSYSALETDSFITSFAFNLETLAQSVTLKNFTFQVKLYVLLE